MFIKGLIKKKTTKQNQPKTQTHIQGGYINCRESSWIFGSQQLQITRHLWYSVASLTLNLSNTRVRIEKGVSHCFSASILWRHSFVIGLTNILLIQTVQSYDVPCTSIFQAECYSALHELSISYVGRKKKKVENTSTSCVNEKVLVCTISLFKLKCF